MCWKGAALCRSNRTRVQDVQLAPGKRENVGLEQNKMLDRSSWQAARSRNCCSWAHRQTNGSERQTAGTARTTRKTSFHCNCDPNASLIKLLQLTALSLAHGTSYGELPQHVQRATGLRGSSPLHLDSCQHSRIRGRGVPRGRKGWHFLVRMFEFHLQLILVRTTHAAQLGQHGSLPCSKTSDVSFGPKRRSAVVSMRRPLPQSLTPPRSNAAATSGG